MDIKIYTNDYLAELEERLSNGTFADYFKDGIFYDPDEKTIDYTLPDAEETSRVFNAEGNSDVDNAIALYETYRLTRTEASNRGLWTYLSLHTFAEYNREHYPLDKRVKDFNSYVHDHYLMQGSTTGMLRHTLCGIWWAVFLSVKDAGNGEDKYELTKIMFRQSSFFSRFLGINLLALQPAVQGILQFIHDNENLFSTYFESRMRLIAIIINRLGGTKLIAAMDKDFFLKELEERRELIEKAVSRDAVKTLI